jgi:hypothetical protein
MQGSSLEPVCYFIAALIVLLPRRAVMPLSNLDWAQLHELHAAQAEVHYGQQTAGSVLLQFYYITQRLLHSVAAAC